MKILLVETSAGDRPGSMHRYANLIEDALGDESAIQIARLNLAPTTSELLRYPRRLRNLRHHLGIALQSARLKQKHPADVYHLIDGSHGYVARWLPRKRTVITLHDLIPYLQSQHRFSVPAPKAGARWLIQNSLRALKLGTSLIAVSQSTAEDALRYDSSFAERLSVVPLAVSAGLLPQDNISLPDWDARRELPRPFLLHVGNNGFYKNRIGAVRIFAAVQKQVPCRLVMAGPPPDSGLTSVIQEHSLSGFVDFVTDPTDSALCDLYRQARLLLFPSYYEGFGWPPLEAMAWGCPVVSSFNGSLAEVVGNAALTADAADESTHARHAVKVLTDRTKADHLVAAGKQQLAKFSRERFRRNLLNVYRSVMSLSETS